MKRIVKKFSKSVIFSIKLLLLAVLLITFITVWKIMYKEVRYFRQGNYIVVLSYFIVVLTFMTVYSGFKIGTLRISELIYSNFLAVMVTNVIIYLQFSLIAFKLLSPVGVIIMTLIQTLFASLICYIGNKIYFTLNPARDVLVICRDFSESIGLINKMNHIKDRYKIREVVLEDDGIILIKTSINKYSSVLLCDIDCNLKKELVDYCYSRNKRLYILPTVADILVNKAHQTNIFDTPVFVCKNSSLAIEQRIAKRMIDILFAFAGIVVASPIMIITAIAIKFYDRGPILFSQQRLTQNGKVFALYKFRSMVVDAERDGIARLASKNDERITKVGKLIRKLRIDELPQLINILAGDMSIVGPRPERPEIAEQYMENMPQFEYRLKVKAGLTGYAQVKGRYNTSPEDKLNLDLLYIENYSIILDIMLMMMTLKIMFMRESTEGVNEGETLPLGIKIKRSYEETYKDISI